MFPQGLGAEGWGQRRWLPLAVHPVSRACPSGLGPSGSPPASRGRLIGHWTQPARQDTPGAKLLSAAVRPSGPIAGRGHLRAAHSDKLRRDLGKGRSRGAPPFPGPTSEFFLTSGEKGTRGREGSPLPLLGSLGSSSSPSCPGQLVWPTPTWALAGDRSTRRRPLRRPWPCG